jgi:hypothetical protein
MIMQQPIESLSMRELYDLASLTVDVRAEFRRRFNVAQQVAAALDDALDLIDHINTVLSDTRIDSARVARMRQVAAQTILPTVTDPGRE